MREELLSLVAGMRLPNCACLSFLISSSNALRHSFGSFLDPYLGQRIGSSIFRKGDCWPPTLAQFIALQLDRPAFQFTSPLLRGDGIYAAWSCPTCNLNGAIDSDLVVCGLCYLTTPWSCQVGRTIQMMRFFRFTLNSLSKKPAHGTPGTLIANKFF